MCGQSREVLRHRNADAYNWKLAREHWKSEGYSGALTPSATENHILWNTVLNYIEHVSHGGEELIMAFSHVWRAVMLKKQADLTDLLYIINKN